MYLLKFTLENHFLTKIIVNMIYLDTRNQNVLRGSKWQGTSFPEVTPGGVYKCCPSLGELPQASLTVRICVVIRPQNHVAVAGMRGLNVLPVLPLCGALTSSSGFQLTITAELTHCFLFFLSRLHASIGLELKTLRSSYTLSWLSQSDAPDALFLVQMYNISHMKSRKKMFEKHCFNYGECALPPCVSQPHPVRPGYLNIDVLFVHHSTRPHHRRCPSGPRQ